MCVRSCLPAHAVHMSSSVWLSLCPGKHIKVLPIKKPLWHIISPRYKGNLSKLKLKGRERGVELGVGVVGEIPVSSENISCPRVLVAAAGVLTHRDPSPSRFSLIRCLSPHTHTHTRTCTNSKSFLCWGGVETYFSHTNHICTNDLYTVRHTHTQNHHPLRQYLFKS